MLDHTASLVARVKESTCDVETQKTQVLSLGQEDPLKKVIATHFSVLAWRNICSP